MTIGQITINGGVDSSARVRELTDAIGDEILRRLFSQRQLSF